METPVMEEETPDAMPGGMANKMQQSSIKHMDQETDRLIELLEQYYGNDQEGMRNI